MMVYYTPLYFDQKRVDFLSKLNFEINEMVKGVTLYNNSMRAISEIIKQKIETLASKILLRKEKIEALVYGSMATGLAVDGSDVDIAIRNLKLSSKEQCLEALVKLHTSFVELPYVTECNVIKTAKVPVIKIVLDLDKLGIKSQIGKIKVDITIDDPSDLMHSVCYGILFTEWVIQKIKRCTFKGFIDFTKKTSQLSWL